ncbi:MAG: glycoside hydrolase family 6 protein [Candidatus Yanofskybacteria bacterium]|nr:glycoside hydrolase family 6 protein [Candidatus Yanofskybacteria bacterium]
MNHANGSELIAQIEVSTNKAIILKFEATEESTYRILSSANLLTNTTSWPSVTNILGSNGIVSVRIPIQTINMYYAIEERKRLLYGSTFYVDTNSDAQLWVYRNIISKPSEAALMQKVAGGGASLWLTSKESDTKITVAKRIQEAYVADQIPVFTLYNIIKRDCSSYSTGGASNAEIYTNWVHKIAEGIGSNRLAIVILEPDSLAGFDCPLLTPTQRIERLNLLKTAVDILKSDTRALVYMDGGHSNWKSVSEMAGLLKRAGVEKSDGFALNVSNFQFDYNLVKYGSSISKLLGDMHFVIDSSRNGRGPYINPNDPEYWCNPPGRALGSPPTTDTKHPLIDAYLWIKVPGESDGTCRGGPPAGIFWPEYAIGLAERASY